MLRIRLYIEVDVDLRKFPGLPVSKISEFVREDALERIQDYEYVGRVKGVYIPNLDGVETPVLITGI